MQFSFKSLISLALAAFLASCSAPPAAPKASEPRPTSVHRESSAPTPPPDAPDRAASKPLKIGFVYVGPVGDAGWTFQHDLGRQAVQKAFGDRVQTTYVEKVSEYDDGRVFRDLAATGNELIFATTFGYMKQIEQVAPTLPSVRFEHAQGYKRAPNVRTYDVRTYEGAYLAGMLAGGMTRNNQLGIVASIPIPEIVAVINAFTLGAQAVNPRVVTRIEWVMLWFDPPKEAAAAKKLFKSGVDVMFQTTDSSAVLEQAESLGRRGIAWDSDMKAFAPRAQLAAVEVNWAPYYLQAVEQALNGTWSSGSTWWGINRNAIDLTHLSNDVPPALKSRIDAARAGIADGTLKIWRGPLQDNQKRLVLPPGQVADDTDITKMNFLVKGVEGRLR